MKVNDVIYQLNKAPIDGDVVILQSGKEKEILSFIRDGNTIAIVIEG